MKKDFSNTKLSFRLDCFNQLKKELSSIFKNLIKKK